MANNLPPVPHHAPLVDPNGILTAVWADWFKQAFARMGGHVSSSNDQLAARFPVATADITDAAVNSAKLAAAVAGNGLSGGAGSALAVNVDGSTIAITADTLGVPNSGIPFAKLLSTDWTKVVTASGYQKLASGLYVQWGVTASIGSGTNASQTFPIAFPTACLQVIAGVRDNSAGSALTAGQWGTGNYSTTGFDLYNRTGAAYVFNWMAVGS